MPTPAADYLKKIEKELKAGNATEHTHRPALKAFVESLLPGVTATNEPKRVEVGAPDFIVTKRQTPLGYIEAKDVGNSLDDTEKSEQIKRYFGLGNLILTDYIEFRWYVLGKRRMVARLAVVGSDGKLRPIENGREEVGELLISFLKSGVPTVSNPKELAERMARLAKAIRPVVLQSVMSEDENGTLRNLMEGFRQVLLHDLTEEQFADMYTQTLCYGLFAARCNHTGSKQFTRRTAPYEIPKTNPFLRDLFAHFAGLDLEDQPYVWAVDDLAALLDLSDMDAILEDFGTRTRREDPVVHFYETFLAAYDPKMREARGVYYTPEPVVSYIVRSVDHILKTDFGLPGGLADASKVRVTTEGGEKKDVHKVQILDPATGTGTFLYGVVNQIYESFQGNKGMWTSYVHDHLLPRLFGFELLMAPYAVAHLKIGLQLTETGYEFQSGERLNVFLTNTLEEAFEIQAPLPFARRIAEEANKAGEVKSDLPIMVVLGNPPYSVASQNKGKWVEEDIREAYYPRDDIKEANPKVLLDDYVKFIRFAQSRIEKTGYGILAFITNHGYLDNTTFRTMRKSLLGTFDDLYVLDIHGNLKKKEISPDGEVDQNVFDIRQGVAIGLLVKRTAAVADSARVRHAELWGMRERKYSVLLQETTASTDWVELEPIPPLYRFVPQDWRRAAEYEYGWRITDVFPVHSTGVKTHRDDFVLAFESSELETAIREFRDLAISDANIESRYNLSSTREWRLGDKRTLLAHDIAWRKSFTSCLYRPFDTRAYYCHPELVDRSRADVMSNMVNHNNNRCMVFMRQVAMGGPYDHFLVASQPVDNRAFYSNKGTLSVGPLYLYPNPVTNGDLFSNGFARHPNLAPAFIADLENRLGMSFVKDGKGDLTKIFGPEDVFNYIYAVFHSPTYRARYAEFLKIDFPRVPLTSKPDLFRSLCAFGGELVALHIMEKRGSNLPNYPVQLPMSSETTDVVDKVRYTAPGEGAESGRVWINKKQYFEPVPPEVWEFHVGGYQVCDKWLKDRKGRTLSYDDLQHYRGVVAALGATIRLMAEVDQAIDFHGGWPIK